MKIFLSISLLSIACYAVDIDLYNIDITFYNYSYPWEGFFKQETEE